MPGGSQRYDEHTCPMPSNRISVSGYQYRDPASVFLLPFWSRTNCSVSVKIGKKKKAMANEGIV